MRTVIRRVSVGAVGAVLAVGLTAPGVTARGAVPRAASTSEFSLVVLGDTQYYAVSDVAAATYRAQTQWVVDELGSRNIVFVDHLGDITDSGDDPAQWQRASDAQQILDAAGVPSAVVRGNHDVRAGPLLFDGYFPPSRYDANLWYGGYLGDPSDAIDDAGLDAQNRDSYQLITAAGVDLLFLHLDVDPSAAEIAWGARVLDAYPSRAVVITTHRFLSLTGDRYPAGQEIWDQLVYPARNGVCSNVMLVLGGHDPGEAQRDDTNACGRTVHQLRSDYQARPNGGDGWLRVLDVTPASDQIDVHTYSPTLGRYETDGDSDFTLLVDLGGVPPPPPPPSQLAFRAATSTSVNATTASLVVPSAVRSGDTLLLFASTALVVPITTEPTGWRLLGERLDGVPDLRTRLYVRTATGSDASSRVGFGYIGMVKSDLVLLAYSGTEVASPTAVASAVETGTSAAHVAPPVAVGMPGSWVVSFWVDRTSATTSWTAPAGDVVRNLSLGSGGGRVTSLGADLGVPSPVGTWPGATAVADASSSKATMWSVVLAPAQATPNEPPAAVASGSCTWLTCAFTGAGSSDPDGTIASYAWDFDDGVAGTGSDVSHTYAAAGAWRAVLTVTDDRGATATATVDVTTVAPPPPPTSVQFRAAAAANANATVHHVAVPAGVRPGDLMLLFVSSVPVPITAEPAGWHVVREQVDGVDVRTRLYARVAASGDAGATVTVAFGSYVKTDLTLLAYAGVAAGDPVVASVAEQGSSATHATPPVAVDVPGCWVVSFWADRSSSTTGWQVPAGQTPRSTSIGTGGGRVTSLATDTGASVAVGTWPGLTATASASTNKATMWSVVLAPGA